MRSALSIRPYRPADFEAFEPTPAMAEERARGEVPEGIAWTITREGAPIACGGAAPLGNGAFSVWSYLSALTLREWVWARRATRRALKILRDGHGARRFVAYAGTREAVGFLEGLGFAELELFIEESGEPLHLMERSA